MSEKKIAIGGDHAGFEYKEILKEQLFDLGWEVIDMGAPSADSVDYPDYVHPLAQKIENGELSKAILICGTGNGVAMTANKYQNVRCGLCWNKDIAELVRLHNDANIIAIPARFVDVDKAKEMVDTFLSTEFEGGRHQRRVSKMTEAYTC